MELYQIIIFISILSSLVITMLFFPLLANLFVFSRKNKWGYALLLVILFLFLFIGTRIFYFEFINTIISFTIGFIGFYLPVWFLIGIPTLILKNQKYQKIIYILIFSGALITSIFASINFYSDIKVNTVKIVSEKISKNYAFLHITDTQFGTLSKNDIQKIGKTINNILQSEKIDATIFTGDMVDTNNYSYDDLSSLSFPDIKQYFSYGNHEFYHNTKQLQKIIDKLGYITLRNKKVDFNKEIEIIGIDDSEKENFLEKNLEKIGVNTEKFSILLYHRPSEITMAKKLGINLMLVGHSHGGQIFPYTYFLKWMFDGYPIGETKEKNFTLYHSNGVGLWGPKMRLGSENEITIIKLKSKK